MEERARVTEADWEDFCAPESSVHGTRSTKNGDDIVINMDGGVGDVAG